MGAHLAVGFLMGTHGWVLQSLGMRIFCFLIFANVHVLHLIVLGFRIFIPFSCIY
jgi:hypothetical protein